METATKVTASITEQDGVPSDFSISLQGLGIFLLISILLALLVSACRVWIKTRSIVRNEKTGARKYNREQLLSYLSKLNPEQVERYAARGKEGNGKSAGPLVKVLATLFFSLLTLCANAQTALQQDKPQLLSQTGVIITLVLLAIPAIAALVLLIVKVRSALYDYRNKLSDAESEEFLSLIRSLDKQELVSLLDEKKKQFNYSLRGNELSGDVLPKDERGLLEINKFHTLPFVATKKKVIRRPDVDPGLSKLISWYLCAAACWLVFGTSVGEYLGIKFVAPEADQLSWLSFGRLRPVHTNAVFWGWASLAMLGLGHYIIPRIGNTKLHSLRAGWISFGLINAAVVLGTLCLMSGINNGGGEYREYIWPVQLLFGIGLLITLANFLQTVASRTTKEIYISGWYIISAVIFAITITIAAYVPIWQDGLGETIIQGYYMHQGVGMWFMLFTLGIVYYFLPQQLNRPIYSYSLGILAFWTQILFYTTIGTHHFVFSAIPWWLQTVSIVGSVGMVIPVVAGTTNFLMTFKGAWSKLLYSYSLPFFLVGIIFYFTGSLQGVAEAFRYTNLIWHFTDFTIAHSHLTMYGIISFLLWGGIYAIVPRLTGREAPQITIGAHFWLALIGLMFYTVSLMYGSTFRGLMWMDGKPFIDSVVFMAPYWLWRAIGGSLMWLSHLFFAFNLYKMFSERQLMTVFEINREKLEKETSLIHSSQL